jgi:hypothetical protein
VTVGPLAPDLYEVQFDVDGLMIADPGSSMPKPQRQVNTSLLEIPGDPPTFLDTRDVPHGTIRAEVYRSKALGATRSLLVYTPPAYDQQPQESVLDAIAAAVIGGASLSAGGIGTVPGTIVGALIIQVLNNILDLTNVSAYWQQIVKGCIIVGAVIIDQLKHHGSK